MLALLTNFLFLYLCIKCFIWKFIIIRCGEMFTFKMVYFWIIICFLTRSLMPCTFFNIVKSSSSSKARNTRDFAFNLIDLRTIICFFDKSTSIKCINDLSYSVFLHHLKYDFTRSVIATNRNSYQLFFLPSKWSKPDFKLDKSAFLAKSDF